MFGARGGIVILMHMQKAVSFLQALLGEIGHRASVRGRVVGAWVLHPRSANTACAVAARMLYYIHPWRVAWSALFSTTIARRARGYEIRYG